MIRTIEDAATVATQKAEAAQRILYALTRRLHLQRGIVYEVSCDSTGEYKVVEKSDRSTRTFRGRSAQDALAQAAQTIYVEDDLL